ncbi:nuclear transport factor 2 family protein [Demequina mangrovi]|uniref:DUF4440 domain-containing protein n=1 Tax=Demequina mangrovi TaxID=1043493 RepID=A0A1H6UQB5_9MICO|nr:DUF4440 domain-containing protein [Demequina mangrovi]SEI94428.1 hypothetical protein SAMN05421637_0491 [Demequina mangrovi]
MDELTLQALEESMWRPETRFDRAYMEAILAPGFLEIGQSGRVWSREDSVGLAPVAIDVHLPLGRLEVVELAPDVAQVRYTSTPEHGSRGAALRSSIWVRTDRWRLQFHQATPTAT